MEIDQQTVLVNGTKQGLHDSVKQSKDLQHLTVQNETDQEHSIFLKTEQQHVNEKRNDQQNVLENKREQPNTSEKETTNWKNINKTCCSSVNVMMDQQIKKLCEHRTENKTLPERERRYQRIDQMQTCTNSNSAGQNTDLNEVTSFESACHPSPTPVLKKSSDAEDVDTFRLCSGNEKVEEFVGKFFNKEAPQRDIQKRSRADEDTNWRDRKSYNNESAISMRRDTNNRYWRNKGTFQTTHDTGDNKSWRDPTHRKSRNEFPLMRRDTNTVSVSPCRSSQSSEISGSHNNDHYVDSNKSWRNPDHRKSRSEFPFMRGDCTKSKFSSQEQEAGVQIGEYSKGNLRFFDKEKLLLNLQEAGKSEDDSQFRTEKEATATDDENIAVSLESSQKTVIEDLNLPTLKSWAEDEDTEYVILQMFTRIQSVESFLRKDTMAEEWYACLVRVVAAIVECKTHKVELSKILQVISASHFLTHLLSNYLDVKQEQGMTWTDAEDFFKAVMKIVQYIAKYVPEKVQNCKPTLRCLQGMTDCIDPIRENIEIKDSISSAIAFITDTQKNQLQKDRNTSYNRRNIENETPPGDFRKLCVIPTTADLSANFRPFLRAIITKGVYKDQENYLDIQFRLLREDFIKPLRHGLQEYREHGHEKSFRSSNIHIYKDVHFVGMTQVKGIQYVLQFDVSNMKRVKWDHCKLLLNGNLLCLSNDNFESSLIFATVAYRDPELLRRGVISVECVSGLDSLLNLSSNSTFVMAETMAYYEAVHPILKGLQTIDSDLPLKEYIISCQSQLKPPSYLLQGVRKYDIQCLMKTPKSTEVSVLNTTSWPPADDMCLNPSQRDAAILALTKEISVIQGPPGTGKTYVGLKVMQVLLENQDRMLANTKSDHDPVLVICYTNHALDQFLEGILPLCPQGMVRVGGNKSSDALRPYNLTTLAKTQKSGRIFWELYCSLNDDARKIEQLKKKLDSLSAEALDESVLGCVMRPKHLRSLQSGPQESNSRSKIHQWLNVTNESRSQHVLGIIKLHTTKLVIKCLHLMPRNGGQQILRLKDHQSIVERVKIYRLWLSNYQQCLREDMKSNNGSNAEEQLDKATLSALYRQSLRPSILNDSEICSVIPPDCYDKIKADLQAHLKSHDLNTHINDQANSDQIIAAWVIGTQNSCRKQLDDYEELKKYSQKFQRNETESEKNVEDVFDDEEEAGSVIRQRHFFEDDEKENKQRDAMLSVMGEFTFQLNRARSLGISFEENVESIEKQEEGSRIDGFQTVTYRKPRTFSRVRKYLFDDKQNHMNEEEEDAVFDVWALSHKERFSLYKLWINKLQKSILGEIELVMNSYDAKKQDLKKAQLKENFTVLRKAKVIGITTTGAAKHRELLEAVQCRIIVVEEAAEVLEAHIITALNKKCKHLILIGDHKQLRPSTTVYEHAKDFGLDVSLFERLINNEIPHVTLNEQHRMRESISDIMRHIYPTLQDHVSVKGYENMRGVSKNTFFIQHNQGETIVKDSLSKSNPFEAKYLVALCRYFRLQGYKESQITMLATYGGQVLKIKEEKKGCKLTSDVRVSTVDNFQGEENDVILLSLVRSNEENNAGFLKVDNRVCVALSRARKGLFAIGNLALLASQSKLWTKIKHTAEVEGMTGDGLPISCPNHPDEKNVIRIPKDFDCSPQGGCLQKCDFRLQCGHICHLTCHGYDPEHTDIKCLAPCLKSCPDGHPCRKRCYEDCGDCLVKVPKLIPVCGHTNYFYCSKTPKDTDCYSQCASILPCDHLCTGTCGNCKEEGRHKKCQVPVTYIWPCNHAMKVPCYYTPDEYPCTKPCGEKLQCGHTCPGKCPDCLEGAVHMACTDKCLKKLFCGHQCQGICGAPCPPCDLPCPVACRHGSCSHNSFKVKQLCRESCIPCRNPCANKCPHRKCSLQCHEICDVEPCDKPCGKIVRDCGHPCAGLCGEICVCRHCHRISRCNKSENEEKVFSRPLKCKTKLLYRIPSCWHVFILEEIDEYVDRMNRENPTNFLRCPQCSIPVQKCHRYDRILKERNERREREKKNHRHAGCVKRGDQYKSTAQKKFFFS